MSSTRVRPATGLRPGIVLLATALCMACASAGSSRSGAGNTLTNADLIATNETDPYLAVQRLRPSWLRARGQTSTTGASVVTLFVNGTPRGEVSNLRSFEIQEIQEIEYLSASEAAFRFGTLAGSGGTLAVTTRR